MRKIISIIPIVIVSVIMILLSACGHFNPPTEDNPTSEIKLEKVMSEINHGLNQNYPTLETISSNLMTQLQSLYTEV